MIYVSQLHHYRGRSLNFLKKSLTFFKMVNGRTLTLSLTYSHIYGALKDQTTGFGIFLLYFMFFRTTLFLLEATFVRPLIVERQQWLVYQTRDYKKCTLVCCHLALLMAQKGFYYLEKE